jgi:hypothetical protein
MSRNINIKYEEINNTFTVLIIILTLQYQQSIITVIHKIIYLELEVPYYFQKCYALRILLNCKKHASLINL